MSTHVNDVAAASFSNANAVIDEDYKALSVAAVLSVVIALCGTVGYYFWGLLVIPIIGAFFGIFGLRSIKKYSGELTGRTLAIAGIVLNAVIFLTATAQHIYIYATEVPDGYTRTAFRSLMGPKNADNYPTPEAIDLDGEQIFIKGYVHLASVSSNSSRNFILVPDYATCCFGKDPPLTHMIEVIMLNDLVVKPSTKRLSLAGTFSCSTVLKQKNGVEGVYYQLEVDQICN